VNTWLVAVAASTGGVQALRRILTRLPADLPAAIVIVQHRPADRASDLQHILSRCTTMPVHDAAQGERIQTGHVYLARPESHITVTDDGAFIYRDGTRIAALRSSANPLLSSAARVYDGHVIAVVLTGGGTDATDGVQSVKARGGLVIAQDEASSDVWSMPASAIRTGAVDYILPIDEIGPAIDDLVHGRPVLSGAGQ
jgi:two-component system chemotaxis response regulator CheB